MIIIIRITIVLRGLCVRAVPGSQSDPYSTVLGVPPGGPGPTQEGTAKGRRTGVKDRESGDYQRETRVPSDTTGDIGTETVGEGPPPREDFPTVCRKGLDSSLEGPSTHPPSRVSKRSGKNPLK